MKWLNIYFEFITERQYEYLMNVVDELTSPTHSFEAAADTYSVVSKMTNEMFASIAESFTLHCARMVLSTLIPNKDLMFKKLKDLKSSVLITNKKLQNMMEKILRYYEGNLESLELKKVEDEIEMFAFPERQEFRLRRKK